MTGDVGLAENVPVVVVGAGIAGLAVALSLAPLPVMLVAGGGLDGGSATALAQGGIAAARGPTDSPSSHARDTIGAAGGLCDEDVAGFVTRSAEQAIGWLRSHGVRFDLDENGEPSLHLEAAHSHPRILHASGDQTGREILRALTTAARGSPSIFVVQHAHVERLLQDQHGSVVGVSMRKGHEAAEIPARAVVLATGGVGGLFAHTTNPLTSVGTGLALGARAGAVLRELEFVQFHPTAMDVGRDPMPLASEAMRGDGAQLVDWHGQDLVADIEGGALAARDVLAKTLFDHIAAGRKAFLQLPLGLASRFAFKYPGSAAVCASAGIDVTAGRLPVRPAAHYHMGGLKVDRRGRTTVDGLWACGEVASTGLHGANRLASNSLLEAVVFAAQAANDIKSSPSALSRRPSIGRQATGSADKAGIAAPSLRTLLDRNLGASRDAEGLLKVIRTCGSAAFDVHTAPMANIELVALMMATGALSRCESRGPHYRSDFPFADTPRSNEQTLETVRETVLELTSGDAAERRVG